MASTIMAAKSGVGSDIFAISALLVISAGVLLILRHFLPLRTTPAYLLVPIFLALALPASIVLLVPIDLASTSGTGDDGSRGIWLPDRVLLVAWRITYWLTFVSTWFILPILGSFAESGYRSMKGRLMYSLRENARYQLIVFGCGAVGLIYIIIQSGFHLTSVKALVMALAYFWGLIFAIYLMGHGLVAIPRKFFRDASISGRLHRTHLRAPQVHDKLEDAIVELEELEGQVTELQKRKNGTAGQFRDWIEDLMDMSNLPESRTSSDPARSRIQITSVPAVVTEGYLADLTMKLMAARHKKIRYVEEWDRLVQDAADTQAILDSSGSKRLEFGRVSPTASGWQRITILTPYTRYILHAHIIPAIRYVHGTFFTLASFCVIWSELIKFALPNLSVIALTVVHYPGSKRGQVGFSGQVIAAAWILYMCVAALQSVIEAKVWRGRALVRRNTYGESACWYAGQIAKLTVPLTYNFITFLPRDVHRSTMFYQFLGKLIDLTPLGKGFDYFFPMFILIPVCATLFKLYGKVKNVFGFGILEDPDDENPTGFGTGGWREGRDLIERDLHGTRSTLGVATPGSRTPRPASLADAEDIRPLGAPTSAGRTSDRTVERRAARERAEASEDDEGGFFQDFAHRVRNTIDTTERPSWLAGLGEGIKRPKWMGGQDGGEGRGQSSNFGRWFGGRPADGRVRL